VLQILRTYSFLLFLQIFSPIARPLIASEINCSSIFFDHKALQQQLSELDPNFQKSIRKDGVFIAAKPEHKKLILARFVSWNQERKLGGNILQRNLLRVEDGDVEATNPHFDVKEALLNTANPTRSNDVGRDFEILKRHGYDRYASLAIVVSHAGLWTRGGGDLVKGLVAFNAAELLTAEQKARVREDSKILVEAKNGADHDEIARARTDMKHIFYQLLQHPRAVPSQLLSLVQVAVLSAYSGVYVPLDSWTAEHTHKAISNYLHGIEARLDTLVLHSDRDDNRRLLAALKRYVAASRDLGESHLFGLQIGIKQISSHPNGEHHWVAASPASSEGAGMFPHYYRIAGRSQALLDRGVQSFLFRNSEIIGPVNLEFPVFASAQVPMGYVVVRSQPGEYGGNPFKMIVPDSDRPWFPMLEQSNIPPELQQGNNWFNTNSIYFDIPTLMTYPGGEIAFEAAGPNFRAKVNAADPSRDMPSILIEGQRPINFVNLKELSHLLEHGDEVVNIHMELLANMLRGSH
jgi:hypothetical protein